MTESRKATTALQGAYAFFSSRFAVDWAAVPSSPYDLSTSPQHETFRPPLKTNFASPIILGFKHYDLRTHHATR
jgi:hypothetical protein